MNERELDLHDVLYQSSSGAVTVHDVIYGFGPEVEASGQDFYAHKTGFSRLSLKHALLRSGFQQVYVATGNLEIRSLSFKQPANAEQKALFGL